MILNKKYSKADYQKLKEKIIAHMKETDEYGEFFPPSIAPVCYNETQGNYYMPETREIILARGWLWEDKIPGTFGKETISKNKIPDTIEEVSDEFFSAIFCCDVCTKNYNIAPNELAFYKKEFIPIPRLCPTCRYKKRFDLQLPRKLWPGKCTCNNKNHGHGNVCSNEFETPYSSKCKEKKIYCESCYNKEVY